MSKARSKLHLPAKGNYAVALGFEKLVNHDMLLTKKGEEWTSPTFLVAIILAILIGLAFLFFIIKLRGTFS